MHEDLSAQSGLFREELLFIFPETAHNNRVMHKDILRLEKKINLLNDKLDLLMQAQGVSLAKSPEETDKEEERKRQARERKQTEILRKQNFRAHLEQLGADRRLRHSAGHELQQRFGLLNLPSAARIREYQRTNDARAFDGLTRKI